MHLHLEVFELYWNKTDKGNVVEPFEAEGTLVVLFSVFTHVSVWETAEKSKTLTSISIPSTALVVVIVMVKVAAELFVTVLILEVIGTVAAFAVAVMALFV